MLGAPAEIADLTFGWRDELSVGRIAVGDRGTGRGEEGLRFGPMEVHRALHPAHERARLLDRQPAEVGDVLVANRDAERFALQPPAAGRSSAWPWLAMTLA